METEYGIKLTERICAIIDRVDQRQDAVHKWLDMLEKNEMPPLYSSVDIRDSGFKAAVVDTNLFPAGFNNLCEHGLEDSIKYFQTAINRRVPNCKSILIVAEEHTRNTWYLEHIRILEQAIKKAGFQVRIATFLSIQPDFCENMNYVELETAANQPVRIFCFKKILSEYKAGRQHYDLIILNNDLSSGIPDILRDSDIPIYPSAHAGWHSRLKSHHFCHAQELLNDFAKIVDLDPWLFSCLFTTVDNVNVNVEADRQKLAEAATKMLVDIQKKYNQHGITEKPYIMLKSDYGTYGMGVLPIEDPSEIIQLNRRDRNNLYKGKSARIIERFIIQEGVPTIYSTDQDVSEVCVYQVENNLIGGFYRSNTLKGSRENLNSQGMTFKKMCPHLKKYGECGTHHNMNVFDVYRILARIAGIAARREIVGLEAKLK